MFCQQQVSDTHTRVQLYQSYQPHWNQHHTLVPISSAVPLVHRPLISGGKKIKRQSVCLYSSKATSMSQALPNSKQTNKQITQKSPKNPSLHKKSHKNHQKITSLHKKSQVYTKKSHKNHQKITSLHKKSQVYTCSVV